MPALPDDWPQRLRLPLIAAPMLRVSGPELVIAACRNGVIGAFPAANARSSDELDDWLRRIAAALERARDVGERPAPFCPNLIVRRAELMDQLQCVLRHRPELVITSVGSPQPVIGPLHDIGCKVFADVASMRHVEKALQAGADGLVLLSAGAGGQTGWVNGLAFVRAVRAVFDGPVVLAGGISDGAALLAAIAAGCDLAYMGTKFIATRESLADPAYQRMLVDSSLDDVMLTRAFTGMDANMLRPSLRAAGIDPATLPTGVSREEADRLYGRATRGPARWKDVWSAGHSVSGVRAVCAVHELVEATAAEFGCARSALLGLLWPRP